MDKVTLFGLVIVAVVSAFASGYYLATLQYIKPRYKRKSNLG